MDLMDFHKLRRAVQVSAYPGSDRDVATMESDLRDLLLSSRMFESVEVERTGDQDQLVIALCRFKPEFQEAEIAREVERLWTERMRYPFWEAHSLLVDPEFVEFEAATRNSDSGHYVTVHMVAEAARLPMQREPQD